MHQESASAKQRHDNIRTAYAEFYHSMLYRNSTICRSVCEVGTTLENERFRIMADLTILLKLAGLDLMLAPFFIISTSFFTCHNPTIWLLILNKSTEAVLPLSAMPAFSPSHYPIEPISFNLPNTSPGHDSVDQTLFKIFYRLALQLSQPSGSS